MSCQGTVKKWFHNRGFGFIAQDADPSVGDIFVHFTGISQPGRKTLNIGEQVTFDLGSDKTTGKPRAENVSGDGTGKSSEELYPNTNPQHNGGYSGGSQPNAYGGVQQQSFGGYGMGMQQPAQAQAQQQQYGMYGAANPNQGAAMYGSAQYGQQQHPGGSYGGGYGQQQQQNYGGGYN